jgi:O-antigen/teichoic acid export membrane protein
MSFNIDFKNNTVLKNIFGLGIYRAGYIIANILLTGLVYRSLANDRIIGVWFTILSILTWINMLDFGLGNGLRNKLSDTLNEKNYDLARKYISTTYYIMGVIISCVLIIFIFISFFINWNSAFKITNDEISNNSLIIIMNFMISFYLVYFYLSLICPIYHALLKSYKVNYISFLIMVLNCIMIFILNILNIKSIIVLSFIYNFTAIIIMLIISLREFKGDLRYIRPSISYIDREKVPEILGISVKFLIIQIATVILFSTDNFIIIHLLGPEEVNPYYFVNKLFRIYITLFIVIITPLWRVFSKAYYDKDAYYIKKTFKNIFSVLLLITLALVTTVFIAGPVINIWSGKNQNISMFLTIVTAIYAFIHIWCLIFQYFLNSVSELNIQVLSFLFAGISNIPISIILVSRFNLGSAGVIIGTIISLLPFSILGPISTIKRIKQISQNESNQ